MLVLAVHATTALLIKLAKVPMKILLAMVTYPAAGVMSTNPTTAPMQKPIAEGFLPRKASKSIHAMPAAAADVLVLANAVAATSLAPTADPALKPNHPNQSKPVPVN